MASHTMSGGSPYAKAAERAGAMFASAAINQAGPMAASALSSYAGRPPTPVQQTPVAAPPGTRYDSSTGMSPPRTMSSPR
jgi:hypothetical protein